MDPSSNGHLPLGDDAVRLAALLAASLGAGGRLLLFTGMAPGAGVSSASAQIATAFANMEEGPILLLDANTRSPGLHLRFHAPCAPGLREVLEGGVTLDQALFETRMANLWLLPAGQPDADFIRLLGSEACRRLLHSLRERFRLTLMDSFPLLRCAETSLLASGVDSTVAVLAAGRDDRATLLELKRTLDGLNAKLLGAVLTREGSR